MIIALPCCGRTLEVADNHGGRRRRWHLRTCRGVGCGARWHVGLPQWLDGQAWVPVEREDGPAHRDVVMARPSAGCAVTGCKGTVCAKGMCRPHYEQSRRHRCNATVRAIVANKGAELAAWDRQSRAVAERFGLDRRAWFYGGVGC